MAKIIERASIVSRPLRPQLFIAFCLVSVLPVLALLNFVFPSFLTRKYLPICVAVISILAIFGWVLLKRIIDSIINISTQTKAIAAGELSCRVVVSRQDEIGELAVALNQMAGKIRDNMDELKIYGERTKDVNLHINKQLFALSGLLQINNLITQDVLLEDLFEMVVARLMQVANSSAAFIVLEKDCVFKVAASCGLKSDILSATKFPINSYLLENLLEIKPYLKADDTVSIIGEIELLKFFNVNNVLVYPIFVCGRPEGVVAIGNQLQNFSYSQDDIELLAIFAKQLALAIENNFLSEKVKGLEVKDVLTGLYNSRYILDRLEEEILRAIFYQQPCAFIVFKLRNLEAITLKSGNSEAERILKKVADVLKSCTKEIDKIGRIGNDEFGLLLPEKNTIRAQEFALQIENNLKEAFKSEGHDTKPDICFCVVENPIDGSDVTSLINKAKELMLQQV